MVSIDIVMVEQEPRVDSRLIAKRLGVEHTSSMKLIKKFQSEFEEFGIIGFEIQKIGKGRGRPERFALLNEGQATFLLTLSKNSPEVVRLKADLTKTFEKLRRQRERQAQLDYQQARAQGKLIRRQETDEIQRFVEYAAAQGSRNAQHYYANLTKMTYKALFFLEQGLKGQGLRKFMEVRQLVNLSTAEDVVVKALRDGMDQELFYKDIYTLAKDRVVELSALVGKSHLAALPQGQEQLRLQ